MINTINNEDCLETIKRIPKGMVDLVFTSPPYNMNLRIRNGKYCSRQVVDEFSTKYNGFSDNLPIDDYFDLHLNIIQSLMEISPLVIIDFQVVTGSKRAWFKIIGELSDYLKDVAVWDKGHGQPAMQSGVINRATEYLLFFSKEDGISRRFNQAQFDRGTLSDIWRVPKARSYSKSHGASMPVDLATKAIESFTDIGQTIYDPFGGTGTTAVAASQLGRNFIVSEISQDYCQVIRERLSQSEIFAELIRDEMT